MKINFNVQKFAQSVSDGDINPLEAFAQLNELEKAIKQAKSDIMEMAITEFDKYGSKEVCEFGYKISISKSGRYSYEHSSDWLNLDQQKKELEKRMQSACKANMTGIDENTGEMIEAAIYKPNKESLKLVKIK